jgi:hypothetical protein
VLPREGFDRYNALFRFLFDVKRVRLALQQAWSPQMSIRGKRDVSQMPVLALRARMQFLVDALCYYLQVCSLTSPQHKLQWLTFSLSSSTLPKPL